MAALGASAPAPAAPPERYEGSVVEAVQAFQRRHGLGDDGVLGRATLAALEVSPARRVRQLELALERLRWTPLLHSPRMVVVNVPEYMLHAYEVQGERIDVRLEMKVIIGQALDQRTPLFNEDMRAIEFSPYWNVPPSIAREELIPHLQRDPAEFARMGYEFVAADGRVVDELEPAHLDAVLQGGWRIRQRPGPRNVLGTIKFVFPNRDAIYLHDTASPRLFERERRDLSHGCIRVAEPLALAKFVLAPQPEWTEDRILEAMLRGESRTLRLAQPVQVLIAYQTALVRQGRPHFLADVYGLDAVLDAELRGRGKALGARPVLPPR